MGASEEQKTKVVAIVGPTASGKTKLGIAIASQFGGEVISADSMQVYKGMDIATAKPTEEEMAGIPHHLIGMQSPEERFHLAAYVELAKGAIGEVAGRGKLPVVVGGTGLYLDTLLSGINLEPIAVDEDYRALLERQAEDGGGAHLLAELAQVDPALAARLHEKDTARLIRGLLVYHAIGRPLSQVQEESRRGNMEYSVCWLGVSSKNRAALYERIDKRVDTMLERGLLNEAEQALKAPNWERTAAAAIGHKELAPFFQGEISLEEAISHLKQQTRRYAKRQLTWFRRNPQIEWLYFDGPAGWEGVVASARERVSQFLQTGKV